MNNITSFQLALTLLTLNSYALCMHRKIVSTTTTITHDTHQQAYRITAQPCDTQKGRRDAYQKWCKTPINWDNNSTKFKTHNANSTTQKNEMDFYRKFSSKE